MARMSLRDDQWERIRPLLPGKQTDCGVTAKDNRTLLEAVLWIARTGAPWRDLPEESGHWRRVYMRYDRWSKKGYWAAIFEMLATDKNLEYLMVDGSIARVHRSRRLLNCTETRLRSGASCMWVQHFTF